MTTFHNYSKEFENKRKEFLQKQITGASAPIPCVVPEELRDKIKIGDIFTIENSDFPLKGIKFVAIAAPGDI